jgi:hypothetical protein
MLSLTHGSYADLASVGVEPYIRSSLLLGGGV